MDNELFELCKEVYELTKWETNSMFIDNTPRYTSDYLLEKLPPTIKNEFDGDDDYLMLYKKSGTWYADYIGQFLRCKDDTPLKALLKLVIALDEAGQLKGDK